MNRLTQIEAARVISVLQTTSEKIKLLLNLNIEGFSKDDLVNTCSEDILTDLSNLKELEDEFDKIVNTGKELKQTSHRQQIKENQQKARETGEKIKDSTIKLERKIKEDPKAMELFCPLTNRTEEAKEFVATFDSLVALSKTRLETTVEQELEKIKRMEVLATKDSKFSTEKAALKKEITAETTTKTKEKSQLLANKERLESTVRKMEDEKNKFIKSCNDRLVQMTNQMDIDHARRMEELRQTNERLQEELETTTRENRMKEKEIRKSKLQTTQEIEQRIAEYDSKMSESRTKRIQAEEKLESERKQIAELEDKIKELDRRAKIDEFQARLDEKIEEAKQEEKRKRHRQIAILQALFRRRQALKVGEQLKKIAARKKKGKKGKKKKK